MTEATQAIPDESRVKEYRQMIKKQYSVDAEFIVVHPMEKTQGGMYEFEFAAAPGKLRRCFYWRFVDSVANGQVAMDVAEVGSNEPAMVLEGWLATRKQGLKSRG
jgi:hypothetical protein